MSALGKVYGDFDSNGQLVEGKSTPAERVIERSVIVTRTVTETPVAQEPVSAPIRAEPAPTNDLFHEMPQPPLPYPLAPRPKPSDLILDRSRDALLTANVTSVASGTEFVFSVISTGSADYSAFFLFWYRITFAPREACSRVVHLPLCAD